MESKTAESRTDALAPVIQQIDCFAKDSSISTPLLLQFELTSGERSKIHEYIKQKGFYSVSVPLKGSTLKKIAVSRVPVPQKKDDEMTSELIDCFSTYSRIPFPCPLPELAEYYVTAYDKMYGSRDAWDLYQKEIRKFAMKKELTETMNKISDYIDQNKQYQALKQRKDNSIKNKMKRDVYHFGSVGKVFLSVDIRKANFTTLDRECPDLFVDQKTGEKLNWHDFVLHFTESEFIARSKQFREIVIGRIGFSGKAKTLQEILMDKVHDAIMTNEIFSNMLVPRMKCGDENVYEINDVASFVSHIDKFKQEIDKVHGPILHYRVFKVESIQDKQFFIKTFLYNTDWFDSQDTLIPESSRPLRAMIEFKKVPKKFMLQVIKWQKGERIAPQDLYFMDEGIKCQYCSTIFE